MLFDCQLPTPTTLLSQLWIDYPTGSVADSSYLFEPLGGSLSHPYPAMLNHNKVTWTWDPLNTVLSQKVDHLLIVLGSELAWTHSDYWWTLVWDLEWLLSSPALFNEDFILPAGILGHILRIPARVFVYVPLSFWYFSFFQNWC
jgi:hypothetical protein